MRDLEGRGEISKSGEERMAHLHRCALLLAPRNIPVLVTGETGVGKEVFVRQLHQLSRRKGKLQVVNCAALPADLSESLLFGHERGAFTGAERRTAGLVGEADQGTLFLDEIGELNARAQAVLLRLLQEKRYSPVGSIAEIAVDMHVIGATHRNLDELVTTGAFRSDLLYRLNAFVFHIPPLRERRDEIPELAKKFLCDARREWDLAPAHFTLEALACLRGYSWPGNVRQLQHVARQVAALVDSQQTIDVDQLPGWLRAQPRAFNGSEGCSCSRSERPASQARPLRQQLRELEESAIGSCLRYCEGNVTKAAALLDIPVRTLSYKMRRYQIDRHAQIQSSAIAEAAAQHALGFVEEKQG